MINPVDPLENRFRPRSLDEMSVAERNVAERILASPRKSLEGPFGALLYTADICSAFERLGMEIRFKGNLPDKLRELVILLVARDWSAQYEWYYHVRMARKAGVAEATIEAIREHRRPAELQADEQAVYDFGSELLATRRVGDTSFEAVEHLLGIKGAIDLICTIGFYLMVSAIINVDRLPVPTDGELLPIPESARSYR